MKSIWNAAFIFGLVFTLIGANMLLQQYIYRVQCTAKAEGKTGTGYQFGMPYKTLVFTANGETYDGPLTSYSQNITEGQTVTVVYNPSNIKKYYLLEDESNVFQLGIFVTIGGIIFMLVGYGVYIGLFEEKWIGFEGMRIGFPTGKGKR